MGRGVWSCVCARVHLPVYTIKARLSERHKPQSYLTLLGQQNAFQDGKHNSKQRSDGTFPGGPVVKNPPSKAEDTGSIPGLGTKIPHAMGQVNTHTTTRELSTAITESMCSSAHSLQQQRPLCRNWRKPECLKKDQHRQNKIKTPTTMIICSLCSKRSCCIRKCSSLSSNLPCLFPVCCQDAASLL